VAADEKIQFEIAVFFLTYFISKKIFSCRK